MLSEIPFPNFPVLFKNSGLSFFILDCEHGGFDYKDTAAIIMNAQLCGIEVVVRLPGNGRKDIVKYLDMGADGLLLPMTNRAEDVSKVVEYSKYSPLGKRGISTMRAHTFYAPPEILKYMREANERIKVYAQIETKAGLDNLQDILSEGGVAGCFIGPNDLSDDYGCLQCSDAPEIHDAIVRVGEITEQLQKTAGIITANKNYLKCAKDHCFRQFCIGSELNAVAKYCRNIRDLYTAL